MFRWSFAVALLVLLAVAPGAHAGGFVTVGLSSTPAGVAPGEPWRVDLTILQHGRTPAEGLEPAVVVTSGPKRATFPAEPTSRPGVYRAHVVFPAAGRWQYEVDDGWGQRHSFPAVTIGGDDVTAAAAADPPASAGGGIEGGWLAAGIAALLAAAGVGLWDLRRRRSVPARSPQPA